MQINPNFKVKYKGGYDKKGRGTPEGDAKDKEMRAISHSAIVELADNSPSSTLMTLNTLGLYSDGKNQIVMLARNGKLANIPIKKSTYKLIKKAHVNGCSFVMGDMPDVDNMFLDCLKEIGANFIIYHGVGEPRFKA